LPYRILTDEDVSRALTMRQVIAKIEDALREKAKGTLVSPPRFEVKGGKGELVFTAGAATGNEKVVGFRVYPAFPGSSTDEDQLVAVFDGDSGAFKGAIIGGLIGAMRTGAIGGVAAKHMSRPDSKVLGIIGSGFQAKTQLEAAAAVRQFEAVRVFSPNAEHRQAFAKQMGEKLSLNIQPVALAEEAVSTADVIICATSSIRPALKSRWLKPGTHVTTIGPKWKLAHEIEMDLAKRAQVIATDSLAQAKAYRRRALFFDLPFFLSGTPEMERLVELSDIVAGNKPGRTSPEDFTLFCSVGLAGTEVVVANEALRRAV
jgi:ornithine cyclodeaminase